MPTRRTTTDRAEPWLVGLIVAAALAAAGAISLAWQLISGGVW